ncbi:MAG TPA: methyltransferase domain-containing protein [Polyangiaceae bacterium]|jgi:FkbM family methyltransferase
MTTSLTHDTPQLAETYDRLSDSQFESGKRLVDRIGVEAGDRVLDVGCGTGRLARWMAERVGPQGSVVGIDPLPERIAIARARAQAHVPAGAPAISFEVGQAEDLSAFAAESFAAVCLSAVFHWVADKPKALREIRRVLRPDGRMGVTTLPRELLASSTVTAVCAGVLTRAPYVERVDLSVLVASRGPTVTDILAMVVESGLQLVQLHVVERTRTHPRGEDVVDFLESSSFGNFLRMVPEELRAPLRVDLAAAFDATRGPEGIVMRDYGTVFVARRGA